MQPSRCEEHVFSSIERANFDVVGLPATDERSAAPLQVTPCRTLSLVTGAQFWCVNGAIGAPLPSSTATLTEPLPPGFVAMLTKKCLPEKTTLRVSSTPPLDAWPLDATSTDAKPARTDIVGTPGRLHPHLSNLVAYRHASAWPFPRWRCP